MQQQTVQLPSADAKPALQQQAADGSLQQLAQQQAENADHRQSQQEIKCRMLELQLATQTEKNTWLQQQLKMQAEMQQQLNANLELQQQLAAAQISNLQQQLVEKKESNRQYKAKVNALEAENTNLRSEAAELQRQLLAAKVAPACDGKTGSGSTVAQQQASSEQQYAPLDKDPVKELLIMLAKKEAQLQQASASIAESACNYYHSTATFNRVESYLEVLHRGLGLLWSFKSYMGSVGSYDKVDKAFIKAVQEARREVMLQFKEEFENTCSNDSDPMTQDEKDKKIREFYETCQYITKALGSRWAEDGVTADHHFWPARLARISWDHAWIRNGRLHGYGEETRLEVCPPIAMRFDRELKPALEDFCEKYAPFTKERTEDRTFKNFDDWWQSWARYGNHVHSEERTSEDDQLQQRSQQVTSRPNGAPHAHGADQSTEHHDAPSELSLEADLARILRNSGYRTD